MKNAFGQPLSPRVSPRQPILEATKQNNTMKEVTIRKRPCADRLITEATENETNGIMNNVGRFRLGLRLPMVQRKPTHEESETFLAHKGDENVSNPFANFTRSLPSFLATKRQGIRHKNDDDESYAIQTKTRTTSYTESHPTSASRALTIYRGPDSLSESIGDWILASESLLRSDELLHFLATTRHVVCSVGDLAIRTAFLPVTVPWHVACSTKDLVVGCTVCVVGSAGSLVESTVMGLSGQLTGVWSIVTGPDPLKDKKVVSTPKKMITKDFEVDLSLVLEKLKLDYAANASDHCSTSCGKAFTSSEFLLRVNDLSVTTKDESDQEVKVFYVDLSSQVDYKAIQLALYRLFLVGVSLLADHPTVRLSKHYEAIPELTINWKCESATSKLLRRMSKMTTLERLHLLQENVLVWSGTFRNEDNKNALPAFLARGIVHKSPRDFMNLIWDNSRTGEYNNYCVARTDAFVIDDKVLEGAASGAKVVQSETRVPYTSLTVKAKCLMHVRPLESPDVGFVILSRSLDAGEAGLHVRSTGGVEKASKNEILWGINIFRAVPSHPHLTDLTSFSQVSSTLVPTFMANRIGLMGVEDFFKNVRASKELHRSSTA